MKNETFTCDNDRRFGKSGRTWHGSNGTVVFQNAFGRWVRETVERERSFATAAEAFSGELSPAPEHFGPPAPACVLADGTLCFESEGGFLVACYPEFA